MNTKSTRDVKWWHLNKPAWIGLGNWVKAHPFKAVGFTYLFCIIAGAGAAMADYWAIRIALPVFIVALVIFMLIMRADGKRDANRQLPLLLALALLLVLPADAPAQQTPELEPAGVGGAVVGVVVIGGVVFSIWLYRFCQRNFGPPPPPPPPPAEEPEPAGVLPGGGTAASATFQSLGSCYELRPASAAAAASADTVTNTVQLTGQLVQSPEGIIEFRVSSLRTAPLTAPVTFEEFKAGWAKHGLTIDDHYTGQVHFGKNGQPSTPEESPFAFDWESRTMTYDPAGQGQTIPVLIERSPDLQTWEPYLSTRMPLGQPVQLSDTALRDKMFYRFRTSGPY